MRFSFHNASARRIGFIVASALAIGAVLQVQGSGAAAQALEPTLVATAPQVVFTATPVIQPLPAVEQVSPEAASSSPDKAHSLAELVAAQGAPETLSPEMQCLAGAIYFESKGQTLPGQLAVGRVIVRRTKSGRFPESYCGVVYQRSQFSFVRGRSMPRIATGSPSWREAVAIAQIADSDSWRSPTEGALFFHATHVSPRWRATRIARVDDHIFYR